MYVVLDEVVTAVFGLLNPKQDDGLPLGSREAEGSVQKTGDSDQGVS